MQLASFLRFDRTPTCDVRTQTDRQTDRQTGRQTYCQLVKIQIPLDGADQTLSETRVYDKVRRVGAGLRQVRGLCLVASGPRGIWHQQR